MCFLVQFVTRMCDQKLWYEFAMNVTLVLTVVGVSFVVPLVRPYFFYCYQRLIRPVFRYI